MPTNRERRSESSNGQQRLNQPLDSLQARPDTPNPGLLGDRGSTFVKMVATTGIEPVFYSHRRSRDTCSHAAPKDRLCVAPAVGCL
jgi:hypothetical protein